MTQQDSTDDPPDSVEYQLGAHPVDASETTLGDDSEFMEWEMEVPTVFKRLADDIYSSREAGVRELLTNAVTAVLTAQRSYDLQHGRVRISLREDADGTLTLVIHDDGTGIPESKLREVLRYIGRSTTRDQGDLAGRFGMGFLAAFKLVGIDSGFVMHTHHRDDTEAPISGVWRSGGFSFDNEGVLPGRLTDESYGTKFEFELKDDISASDVRTWVKANGEFARVPVSYVEYDKDGLASYERQYGTKSFTDAYADESPHITVDTEHYTAVMSPDAESQTVLLDVPVRRNHYGITDAPWKVDVRLKNENGIIIDGPHSGLMPVTNGEYDEMPPERQAQYLPERAYEPADVSLPSPTGTRDTLEGNQQFWNDHLGSQLLDAYNDAAAEVFEQLSDPSDVFSLSEDAFLLAMNAVETYESQWRENTHVRRSLSTDKTYTHDTLSDDIAEKTGVDVPQAVAETLVTAQRDVTVFDPDCAVDDQPSYYDDEYGPMPAWKVHVRTDGDIYMGVSLNQLRADVVWADDADNRVVELEEASQYATLETHLGWQKLKDVNKSTLDDYEIGASLRDDFETGLGRQTTAASKGETLTVHFKKSVVGRSKKYKESAEEIRALFDDDADSSMRVLNSLNPELLVVFSDSSAHNVSDYYWLSDYKTAVTRCSQSVAEYLTEVDSVVTYESYKSAAESATFTTSDGSITLHDSDQSFVYHALPDRTVEVFRQTPLLDTVPAFINSVAEADYAWPSWATGDETVYVPLTRSELREIQPVIRQQDEVVVLHGDVSSYRGCGNEISIDSDARVYAASRLSQHLNDDDSRLNFFNGISHKLTDGVIETVDSVIADASE